MSTLKVGTIQSNTASTPPTIQDSAGTQVGTFCRAWVNFNGTGTVAIRASFNVTSITDNNTGDYTVNFTNAMADANFAVSFSSGGTANAITRRTFEDGTARSSSALRVFCANTAFAAQDHANVDIAIFR